MNYIELYSTAAEFAEIKVSTSPTHVPCAETVAETQDINEWLLMNSLLL